MFTKKKIIILSIILIIGSSITAYFFIGRKPKTEYIMAKVARGNLIQTVSQTGTVKATREIELNFLNSGKLGSILVKIGDKVKQGQILAQLDYSGLEIKEKQAEASLAVTQANLAKLLAGATSQQITVSQTNVDQAKSAYDSALIDLEKTKNKVNEDIRQAEEKLSDLQLRINNNVTTYEQAVATAETDLKNTISTYQRSIDNSKTNALITSEAKINIGRIALDNINTILTDEDGKYSLSMKNQSYLNETKIYYAEAVKLFDTADISLAQAKSNQSIDLIKKAITDSLAGLNKSYNALDSCYDALENSITSSIFTQTELDTYKTNISAQLTAVSTGISAVQTAGHTLDDAVLNYNTKVSTAEKSLDEAQNNLDNAILTAKNSLATAKVEGEQQLATAKAKVEATLKAWQVAKAQLNQLISPARSQDIDLARAQVDQAQAELDSVKNQIENSIIKAPIDGVITKKNYEIGEQTTLAKPVLLMLGENNFEIELDISEADIAKIEVNDKAEITLDAFGEDVKFFGPVYFIEPAETVIQDVIYYKTKVNFDPKQEEIKSGMTANVIITTANKENVLLVPSRSIIEKNSQGKFIRLLEGGKVKEVPITIGLRGDEGLVEVLSGVKEGEEIIAFTKENK